MTKRHLQSRVINLNSEKVTINPSRASQFCISPSSVLLAEMESDKALLIESVKSRDANKTKLVLNLVKILSFSFFPVISIVFPLARCR